MVLAPKGGLGRVLLVLIVISTISYLVLNIVSFAGARWISYTDVPVRFGLWKVCDTTASGLCNQWGSDFSTNVTRVVFGGEKPGFIRTSQALEIISLIFYIFAAVFIIIGLVDLPGFPFEIAFGVAIFLLLVCITFLSATLGVMSVQGRSGHTGFHDWAWWNGLVGLIMTIICFFSLIFLILYMNMSKSSPRSINRSSKAPQGGFAHNNFANPGAYSLGHIVYPSAVGTGHFSSAPEYPNYGHGGHQYGQGGHYPQVDHYPQQYHHDQYYNQQYQNPMLTYGNQSSSDQYYHQHNQQTPSPIISELARQYVSQANQSHYTNQLMDPYRNYLHDPYLIHNYL